MKPRVLTVAAGVLAAATLAGIVALRPTGARDVRADLGVLYDARVEHAGERACAPDTDEQCPFARVRLLGGPDRGDAKEVDLPHGEGALRVRVGERIVVAHFTNPEASEAGVEYQLADRNRKPALFWLAVVFAVAVVALGRLRGLAALAGLGVSLFVLVQFVLPAILDGRAPVPVAITGAAAIAFVSLYAAHGFSPKTTVALLGTLSGLGIALGMGSLFAEIASLSGLASEEATTLSLEAGRIDFSGLLLAGLVIGALGAIDDVTVTQSSAVFELAAASPHMPARDLARAGMRIGRDHVGSTVNTLVLAYAGASMSLLLLFALSDSNLRQVANGELVATEIVRTLAGSVGLVASVPITTFLAVRAAAPVQSRLAQSG